MGWEGGGGGAFRDGPQAWGEYPYHHYGGQGVFTPHGGNPHPPLVEWGVLLNQGQRTLIWGGCCNHAGENPPIREYTPIRGVPPIHIGLCPDQHADNQGHSLHVAYYPRAGEGSTFPNKSRFARSETIDMCVPVDIEVNMKHVHDMHMLISL